MSDVWKSVIDADLKDAEYTPRAPITPGDYNATVTDIKAKTFESKAKGVEVTFAIQTDGDFKGRDIRDYIVLVNKEGLPNKRGAAILKKLMLECGLDTKSILNFKFPEFDSKSFGDFKKLLDQPVEVTLKNEVRKQGNHAGKTFSRVESFKAAA